uniref:ShKT domain-containing protein n=1 Tax=Panagrolaimus sp. ES5 TaxID=591445 RepID=A0AC34FN26_9BILA
MLNLDPDIPALQLPLAPLTTLAPSNSFKQQSENDINDEGEMPGMEPEMPIEVPPFTTTFPPVPQNNILQPPMKKSFRDPEYFTTAAPAYEPMPPSYNSISEFEAPITNPPLIQQTEYYPSAPETYQYIDNAVTIPATTMPPDYEDERNIESEAKRPFNWEETADQSRYQNTNNEFSGKPSNQNYEDYDTTMPSSYRMSMMGSPMSRPKSPWSWKDLEYKLKSRPFYSVDQSGTTEDFSPNCCQWALDGLCDRSWQRVRQLCPKSCGTVICTTIDGGLSCNRAIDVDVLDCFQRRRFYMLHAAPLNYPPRNYQTRANRPPLNHRKKIPSKDSSMFRAYAIENEIKGFNSGFK